MSSLSYISCHEIAKLLLANVRGKSTEFYATTAALLSTTYLSIHAPEVDERQQSSCPLKMKFSAIDEAELGDTVYYVSDKDQERIEGKQAELLAIDRQAGESPFYTIKIHDSTIE